MALAGNLRDFGVPDILQLIMTQEKTGVLTLKSDSKVANIGFEKGQLVEATYGEASRDYVLKDYFVKSERISKEELQEIERHQAETGSSFEEILLKFGFVSEQEVERMVAFRIQEVLDILLTWKEGEYRFDTDATIYPKGVVRVSVNPQAVIMEGMRRIDEWPRIERILPDPNIILGRKAKPILSVEFGPEEKRVLEFVDGVRTLSQLQEVTGVGKFRTYQACFNLLEVGALEKKGLASREIGVRKKKPISLAKVKGLTFAGLGWALIVAFVIGNLTLGLFFRNYLEERTEPPVSSQVENNAGKDMSMLLDQFFLKNGRYPASLDVLVSAGWTTPQAIARFNYQSRGEGDSYILTPLPGRRSAVRPLF
ncbi:MAG: DUF4388 domain-containing protein [bacterium]